MPNLILYLWAMLAAIELPINMVPQVRAEQTDHAIHGRAFLTQDYLEAELYARFLTLKGVLSGAAIVDQGVVTVMPLKPFKEVAATELYSEYKKEMGIDLNIRAPGGKIVLPFPIVTLSLSKVESIRSLLSSAAPGSLFYRSIRSLVEKKEVQVDDRVTYLKYSVRPWISEKEQRCEHLQGEIHVKMAKNCVRLSLESSD